MHRTVLLSPPTGPQCKSPKSKYDVHFYVLYGKPNISLVLEYLVHVSSLRGSHPLCGHSQRLAFFRLGKAKLLLFSFCGGVCVCLTPKPLPLLPAEML